MDDSKENASSSDESFTGTPTGRFQPNTDDLFVRMFRGLYGGSPPTYMREAIEALADTPEIPVLAGLDFSQTEDRVVAMLVKSTPSGMVIKHIMEGELQGRKVDFVIMDDIMPLIGDDLLADIQLYNLPAPEPMMMDKPLKQNGKDASYLDLDPTKKHRRRRR